MSIAPQIEKKSFIEMLRVSALEAKARNSEDPWKAALRRVRGRIGHDGVERISTNDLFDVLEIPIRRRPSVTVRLSRVMQSLGWSNVRARGLNPGSYRDRVRGYARDLSLEPNNGDQ